MTLSKIIEQLKAADQNKTGMFELGEDVMCALVDLLERRERDKQESLLKCSTRTCAAPPAPIVPTFEVWCQRVEQNPVGWVREAMKEAYEGCRAAMHGASISNSADFAIDEASHVTAPVVPDANYQQLSELYHAQEKRLFKIAQRIKGPSFDKYAYSPSQAIDVLEVAIFGESNDDGSAAALNQTHGKQPASNSPAVPDGWQLVPVEPTEDMVIEGFESEPDEFFSQEEEWEAYQDMSGCEQAAHRAKLCWAAMLAAAPQQESE